MGRHNSTNTLDNNTNNNNANINRQYQRQSSTNALDWSNRRNLTCNSTSPQNTTDQQEEDSDIINSSILQIEEVANAEYYKRWHVPRLGNMTENRPDGVYRFMGAQLNSISSADRRDRKVADIDRIMETWEVQGGCFQEIGINWTATSHSRNMASWFRLKNQEIRTHTAHNIHENVEASQQGGVGQFMCKDLVSFAKETESDFRGLGRWCSWLLYANPTHKTRVVTAYNLGKRKSNHLGTVYQQQLRHIQLNALEYSPYDLFTHDFTTAIDQWINAGERLLIFVDMNEHILHGQLSRKLIELGLTEATHPSWGTNTEPNTHISGSKPIDGVYHTSTLEVTSTSMLSFHEGVGDHRTMLVDISARSLLGTDGLRIVRPPARRLTCSNRKAVERFNKYVEGKLQEHNLHHKLAHASQILQNNSQDELGIRLMELIDTQTTQILKAGEKQCRKITNNPLPFSAPVAYWVHRKWAYQGLKSIAQGNCKNIGNARRRARKEGLDTYNLTKDQCSDGIKVCINHIRQLKTQAIGLRKVHLRNCLILAEEANDKERYKGILRVIEREEQKNMWRSIRRVTDDPRLGAITFVQRETEDGTIDVTDMDDMCEEIQSVTERRFALAESAPATRTTLRDTVGFLADTDYAVNLLSGCEQVPEDVDPSTRLVIEEMQRLWNLNGRERFHAFTVTPSDYRNFWKRIKESTSSSISGLHFGLYKAAMASDIITNFLADKITVIASYGCPPTRWGCGLQVMLEKIAGVALVNKLRAILLMEGDYNFFNKWVFGYKALDILYQEGYIPQDQYSQRESTAEDARMDNRLTMDISRQQRIPLAAVSVDADKCYDRINHIIMSLALMSIVGTAGLITALLYPIQTMKFYQRTAWGDSKTYMGGRTRDNPLQGLCQGNGAAPACWLIISSILMHCYSRQGFGSSILAPISKFLIHFLGEMYVDDTDLIITDPSYRSGQDVLHDTQTSVDIWANLLISTGGSLNPDKCYWYMVDYTCINGEWNYAPFQNWELTIPMPDGTTQPITQLDIRNSQKMLGVWSNPSGDDTKHLETNVLGKYSTWIDRTMNGHLPTKFNWTSYKFKLFPGMRYGLATLATTTSQIGHLLQKLDYKALPLLGVNRSVKREWRSLPRAFGGIGLYDLAAEQMIGWANMLLQHYGSPTTLGQKCRSTLESLQLEIGCRGNPLRECYRTCGILATPSWITSVWERSHQYNLNFHLEYDTLELPRENDITIVNLLLRQGISGMEFRQINRCRLALRAIFLSDIVTAGGRHLEQWVRENRNGRESQFTFAREQPTHRDWKLWDDFWSTWENKNNSLPITLGRWMHQSHQIWKWFFDNTSYCLWETTQQGWMKYEFDQTGINTRRNQIFRATSLWQSAPEGTLVPVSVIRMSPCTIQLLDVGTPLPSKNIASFTPANFWEFVWKQGGTWMWEFIEGKHDDMSWIKEAMQNNTAIMVTDGSFNRAIAPTISGAGWLLVCTKSLQMIRGSFYEESPQASSYRGELLGLTAIHHLAAFALEFYEHSTASGSIHCDNKGALHQASLKRRRVRTGSKHSDLLRNLRYIKSKHLFESTYRHVKAHQDNIYAFDDLTLVQQFNVICDTLAKQAVQSAITNPIKRCVSQQFLPREQAALIIDGHKQTTDVSTALRFSLGKKEARKFFTKPRQLRGNSNAGGLGWTGERFDCIDWMTLNAVITKKPDMYGVWLSKQTIGICATRRSMARIMGTTDDRCPNCLAGPENSDHLNRCMDSGRTLLFDADLDDLRGWLLQTTDRELGYWLYHYWLLRGEYPMASLGMTSPAMQEIAAEFDLIGWNDTLHGRLPLALLRYQNVYCISVNSRSTGADWMKILVTKLLKISHSQWLYRNFSLHNKINGHLRLTHQVSVLEEIARLSTCNPEEIPEECRFLLDVEMTSIDDAPLTQQEYWISAMTAALAAGRRYSRHTRRPFRRQQTNLQTTSPKQQRDKHRFRRRIATIVRQMQEDLDLSYGSWRSKRGRPHTDVLSNGSNKRLRKPD